MFYLQQNFDNLKNIKLQKQLFTLKLYKKIFHFNISRSKNIQSINITTFIYLKFIMSFFTNKL